MLITLIPAINVITNRKSRRAENSHFRFSLLIFAIHFYTFQVQTGPPRYVVR